MSFLLKAVRKIYILLSIKTTADNISHNRSRMVID